MHFTSADGHILVDESVRGDGGVLPNSMGKRFMFDYVPDVFRAMWRHAGVPMHGSAPDLIDLIRSNPCDPPTDVRRISAI